MMHNRDSSKKYVAENILSTRAYFFLPFFNACITIPVGTGILSLGALGWLVVRTIIAAVLCHRVQALVNQGKRGHRIEYTKRECFCTSLHNPVSQNGTSTAEAKAVVVQQVH